MGADPNNVSIGGRLTRDAEVHQSNAGKPIVKMRLACSTRARSDEGTWGDRSNYFDVVYFPSSDGMVQYLEKGKQILVEGRLSWREYQTTDGQKRQSVEIVARDVILQGGGGEGGAGSNVRAPRQQVDDLAPAPAPARALPSADDDIPF